LAKKKKIEVSEHADWDVVVAGISKKLGSDFSAFNLGKQPGKLKPIEVFPSNLLSLDNSLGIFGWPRGRIIELYGPESAGKTSIALHTALSAMRAFPNKPVVYVDLEHSLNPSWIKTLGIDLKNFWLTQPDCGEDAVEFIIAAAESGQPSLIVLDSVAAVATRAELEGTIEASNMGKVGQLMGRFIRKVVKPLHKNMITFLAINQIRMKLGTMPGEERPGGKALRYFASIILRCRKSGDVNFPGSTESDGIWIELEVKKNKVAPPFKKANIPLLFKSGFSEKASLVEAASQEGIIEKSGSWYSYNGQTLGQGPWNTADNIDDKTFKEIYNIFKNNKLQIKKG
jgi:recombination protein RecA